MSMSDRTICIYFDECEKQENPSPTDKHESSQLIAFLKTPTGVLTIFPSLMARDLMKDPGWYLVRLSFAPESRIGVAEPIITKEITYVAYDLLRTYVRYPSATGLFGMKEDCLVALHFEYNHGRMVSYFTVGKDDVRMIVVREHMVRFMPEDGWYMVRLNFESGLDHGWATLVTTEEHTGAVADLLGNYGEFKEIREQLMRSSHNAVAA